MRFVLGLCVGHAKNQPRFNCLTIQKHAMEFLLRKENRPLQSECSGRFFIYDCVVDFPLDICIETDCAETANATTLRRTVTLGANWNTISWPTASHVSRANFTPTIPAGPTGTITRMCGGRTFDHTRTAKKEPH